MLALLVWAVACFLPGVSWGQLTIQQAMELAAENTEAAQLFDLRAEIANQRYQSSLGELLPRLTASASTTRNQDEVVLGERNFVNLWDYGANLQLSIDIFDGTAIPSRRAAGYSADATRDTARWERAGLRLAAGRAYLAGLTARANLEAARESLVVREASLAQTEALIEAGYTLRADVSRAELAVIESQTAILNLELELENALELLEFLTGVEEISADDLRGQASLRFQDPPAAFERADVAALDDEVAAQSSVVTGHWLSFLPNLSLVGRVDFGPETVRAPTGTTWTVSLTASWLLFDYGRYGDLEGAQLERESLEASRTLTIREIELDVSAAQRRLEVSEARLELSAEGALVATQTRELTQEQFELGTVTALEMMEADEALFEAQTSLNLARLERDLAELELAYVVGALEGPVQ